MCLSLFMIHHLVFFFHKCLYSFIMFLEKTGAMSILSFLSHDNPSTLLTRCFSSKTQDSQQVQQVLQGVVVAPFRCSSTWEREGHLRSNTRLSWCCFLFPRNLGARFLFSGGELQHPNCLTIAMLLAQSIYMLLHIYNCCIIIISCSCHHATLHLSII